MGLLIRHDLSSESVRKIFNDFGFIKIFIWIQNDFTSVISSGRANILAPIFLAMVIAYLAFKNFSCKINMSNVELLHLFDDVTNLWRHHTHVIIRSSSYKTVVNITRADSIDKINNRPWGGNLGILETANLITFSGWFKFPVKHSQD